MADKDMNDIPRTHLAFHYDAKLYKYETTVQSVRPFAELSPEDQSTFKLPQPPTADDYVVIVSSTIFHPQGGGQPSDEGSMSSPASASASFTVSTARTSSSGKHVLHLGRFSSGALPFTAGTPVTQALDVEKRLLYSRLHTAGHVLGAAVRHLLEDKIAGFDELKASHFPDSAGCEFAGSIGGEWKEPIQRRVDDYVAAAYPVEIAWWDEDDFRARDLGRLIPPSALKLDPNDAAGPDDPAAGKFRVVDIKGAEVYPCGGTHVDSADLCGHIKVRKISRSKGQSRVAYTVT